MRGKKTDPEFVAAFIQESTILGCETSEDIVQRAKTIVQEIDEKIKEVERLKITRSKILDVIATFDKSIKDRSEDAKLLSFFKLEYPRVCKSLCEYIKQNPIPVAHNGTRDSQTIFSIKQLLEFKIISRVGDYLVRGDRFDDYMKFVVREVE